LDAILVDQFKLTNIQSL